MKKTFANVEENK